MQNDSVYNQMTRSEKEVAKFLKETGIFWSYEKPVYIWDENNRPRVWTPDFFLISFGVYVEVCSSENFDYEYRKNVYKKNNYDVVFLHLYKESNMWKEHLLKWIKGITNHRNENLNKIIKEESSDNIFSF